MTMHKLTTETKSMDRIELEYVPARREWWCSVTIDGVTLCAGWAPTRDAGSLAIDRAMACHATRRAIGRVSS